MTHCLSSCAIIYRVNVWLAIHALTNVELPPLMPTYQLSLWKYTAYTNVDRCIFSDSVCFVEANQISLISSILTEFGTEQCYWMSFRKIINDIEDDRKCWNNPIIYFKFKHKIDMHKFKNLVKIIPTEIRYATHWMI